MTVDPDTAWRTDDGANGDSHSGGGPGSGAGAGAGSPPPPPPDGTGPFNVHDSNVTTRFDGIVTVRVTAVPVPAPPQPANDVPLAGTAVKVTRAPATNA